MRFDRIVTTLTGLLCYFALWLFAQYIGSVQIISMLSPSFLSCLSPFGANNRQKEISTPYPPIIDTKRSLLQTYDNSDISNCNCVYVPDEEETFDILNQNTYDYTHWGILIGLLLICNGISFCMGWCAHWWWVKDMKDILETGKVFKREGRPSESSLALENAKDTPSRGPTSPINPMHSMHSMQPKGFQMNCIDTSTSTIATNLWGQNSQIVMKDQIDPKLLGFDLQQTPSRRHQRPHVDSRGGHKRPSYLAMMNLPDVPDFEVLEFDDLPIGSDTMGTADTNMSLKDLHVDCTCGAVSAVGGGVGNQHYKAICTVAIGGVTLERVGGENPNFADSVHKACAPTSCALKEHQHTAHRNGCALRELTKRQQQQSRRPVPHRRTRTQPLTSRIRTRRMSGRMSHRESQISINQMSATESLMTNLPSPKTVERSHSHVTLDLGHVDDDHDVELGGPRISETQFDPEISCTEDLNMSTPASAAEHVRTGDLSEKSENAMMEHMFGAIVLGVQVPTKPSPEPQPEEAPVIEPQTCEPQACETQNGDPSITKVMIAPPPPDGGAIEPHKENRTSYKGDAAITPHKVDPK